MYIFGGSLSTGAPVRDAFFGLFQNSSSLDNASGDTYVSMFTLDSNYLVDGILVDTLSIGDWLSTTFTIITLILMLVVLCKLVVWLFKWASGLFRW